MTAWVSIAWASVLLAGLLLPQQVHCAGVSERPVRLIFPLPSGSASDAAARALAQRLSKLWGRQVVVDNRPGAGTTIATDLVAKATADGYTMGWVIAAHAINPSLFARLPYDSVRDLRGVTLVYQLKFLIVTAADSPLTTPSDLVAAAKAKPGRITFTSAAVGTGGHLLGELFKLQHGLEMEHVGYKGAPAAHPDVIAGRVPVMFDTLPSALPHIQAGRLKAIAVVDDKPHATLPGVPALKGLLPANAVTGWNGIVVPAGAPRQVVAKLHAGLLAAIRSPEVQSMLATLHVETVTSTPEQFDDFIQTEIVRWGEVVKRTGVRLH
ncbi:MAG: tripartite tricarboxylate transporter substrate-binding protein [Burkholderiales bacterium]